MLAMGIFTSRRLAITIILVCSTSCYASVVASPMEKVVQLLADLKAKTLEDGKIEQEIYDKYACWCTRMAAKKGASMEKTKAYLKDESQDIQSDKAQIAKISTNNAGISKQAKGEEETQMKATALRKKENTAFLALRAELVQAISTLEQALHIMGTPVAKSSLPVFLQRSQVLSNEAVEAVATAIDNVPDRTLGSLPSAMLYQLQSFRTSSRRTEYIPKYTSITGILQKLHATLTADLQKETTTEATRQKDFEKLMAASVKSLTTFQQSQGKNDNSKGKQAADLSKQIQNFHNTESQLSADIKVFDATQKSCEKAAADWQARKKLRIEEIAGIDKAIQILSSDSARKTFSNATKSSAASFLQIAAFPSAQRHAFQILKVLSAQSKRFALAKVAAQVRLAKTSDFKVVIAAIDKLIVDLKKEQKDDKLKKSQCLTTRQQIAKKSAKLKWKIERNDATLDKLSASIKKAEDEKQDVVDNIAEQNKYEADIKKERKEENAAFTQKKADSLAAIKLINSAQDALLAYYKKHKITAANPSLAQSSELVSKFDPNAPKFSAKGSRAGQTKGITLLMQLIVEDIQDDIATATKEEKDAKIAFDKEVALSQKLLKDLDKKKVDLDGKIADLKKDKKTEQDKKKSNEKALQAEVDESANIKDDCDFIINNFRSRYDQRQAERDALEKAKASLAASFVQTRSLRHNA